MATIKRNFSQKFNNELQRLRNIENSLPIKNLARLPHIVPRNSYEPQGEALIPPTLKHNLTEVFKNKGPHFLKNPETGVYNFDSYLEKIPQLSNKDIEKFIGFVKVGEDSLLHQRTRECKLKFCSSTSSVNDVLLQIHFMISNRKSLPPNENLSENMKSLTNRYSPFMCSGTLTSLRFRNNVYGLEALKLSKAEEDGTILSKMGNMLEYFLTHSKSEFDDFYKLDTFPGPEAYHYAKVENMLIRSQLDSFEQTLPKKTFDLKTRAVLAIRKDVAAYKNNLWYKIKSEHGQLESFEREKFDMLRSAFLKYSLQARLGNMDGIFVAYHNTAEIFGFEYISLDEMETATYGSPKLAEKYFSLEVQLLSKLLELLVAHFPEQDTRILIGPPARNSLRIVATSINGNARPAAFQIIVHSVIDGKYQSRPDMSAKEDWKLYYEIKTLNYNAEDHRLMELRYESMFNQRSSGGEFNLKLRQLIEKN